MRIRTLILTLGALAILAFCLLRVGQITEARGLLAVNPKFSLVDGRITLREHYSGKYLNGKKVGHSVMRLAQDGDSGAELYHSHVDSRFSLSMLGQDVSFSQISDATLRSDLTLQSIRSVFKTAQAQDTLTVAEVAGGVLHVTNHSMGQISTRPLPLSGPVYTLEALYPYIVQKNLKPGTTTSVKIFEPTLGGLQKVSIRVLGKRVVLHQGRPQETTLVEMDLLGTTQRSWLGPEGNPRVEETGMGGLSIISLEEPAEDAVNLSRSHLEDWQFETAVEPGKALEDLFTGTLIASNVRFAAPQEVFSATYRLEAVPPGTFPDDAWDGRQRLLESNAESHVARLVVRAPTLEELLAGVRTGYRLGDALPSAFEADLASSLRVQSAHPQIVAQAREIVGEESRPERAALAIYEWMADENNVRKELRATLPDALEVLATRAGDCNEHAVLFAALARAVGIPTRMVTGIVYSPDLGQFGYHAWNEVLIGLVPPTWHALDATLGQTRVDATHIKIAVGEIEQQLAIIPLVGRMKLFVEAHD